MKIMKHRPLCKASGKAIYPDEKIALRGMMRIYSHDPSATFGSLHTYVCPSCKKWHIGGLQPKKYNLDVAYGKD